MLDLRKLPIGTALKSKCGNKVHLAAVGDPRPGAELSCRIKETGTCDPSGYAFGDPGHPDDIVGLWVNTEDRIRACIAKYKARKPWRPKEGDKCRVKSGRGSRYCDEGEVITMIRDDGTDAPKFTMVTGTWYIDLFRLEPA